MTETGYKEILVNIQIIGTAVCIKTLVQLSAVCIGSVESVPVAKESRTQYQVDAHHVHGVHNYNTALVTLFYNFAQVFAHVHGVHYYNTGGGDT